MTRSYEITAKPDSGHMHVGITGEVAPGMAERVARDVIAIFDREKSSRVLVDVRGLTVRVNPVETVGMVSAFPGMLKGRSLAKTAVLYKQGDHDTLRFYETVALNRGYQTAIFTDMADAVRWLEV